MAVCRNPADGTGYKRAHPPQRRPEGRHSRAPGKAGNNAKQQPHIDQMNQQTEGQVYQRIQAKKRFQQPHNGHQTVYQVPTHRHTDGLPERAVGYCIQMYEIVEKKTVKKHMALHSERRGQRPTHHRDTGSHRTGQGSG